MKIKNKKKKKKQERKIDFKTFVVGGKRPHGRNQDITKKANTELSWEYKLIYCNA